MPDARTHDIITIASAVALAPVAHAFQVGQGLADGQAFANTAILCGAHLLSGLLFSPDLDLDSAIDNRWGPLMLLWRPYMLLIPHRHFWSHSLVVSPLLRLGYFYGMLVLIFLAVAWLLAQVGVILPAYHRELTGALLGVAAGYPQETAAFMLGFISGSAAHTIADWLVTGGKRYLAMVGIRIRRDYSNHDRWAPRRRRRA